MEPTLALPALIGAHRHRARIRLHERPARCGQFDRHRRLDSRSFAATGGRLGGVLQFRRLHLHRPSRCGDGRQGHHRPVDRRPGGDLRRIGRSDLVEPGDLVFRRYRRAAAMRWSAGWSAQASPRAALAAIVSSGVIKTTRLHLRRAGARNVDGDRHGRDHFLAVQAGSGAGPPTRASVGCNCCPRPLIRSVMAPTTRKRRWASSRSCCSAPATLHGDFHVPLWVVLAAQTAMGLGTLMGGWRIVRTMGSRLPA